MVAHWYSSCFLHQRITIQSINHISNLYWVDKIKSNPSILAQIVWNNSSQISRQHEWDFGLRRGGRSLQHCWLHAGDHESDLHHPRQLRRRGNSDRHPPDQPHLQEDLSHENWIFSAKLTSRFLEQTWPLFIYFHPFQSTVTNIEKSVDIILGIWTRDRRI